MTLSMENTTFLVSNPRIDYLHLSPRCLSIVKHVNNLFVAYLKYDIDCYGQVSKGRYCSLSVEKSHHIWRMQLSKTQEHPIYGLSDLIDGLNHVVFESMGFEPLHEFESLGEFESKDIDFENIDLKINGLHIAVPHGFKKGHFSQEASFSAPKAASMMSKIFNKANLFKYVSVPHSF